MERDLTALMHANVQAREESIVGLSPSAAVLAGTARRVRHHRTVRHAFRGAGAAAAVVALAGASWFGLRGTQDPAPPSVTPSVTTSTPTPTSAPEPVALDEIPGLPPSQALPLGLLEQTTPGWVLTIYRSQPADAEEPAGVDGIPPAVAHIVLLVSPSGERYRAADLPIDMGVRLLRWTAGTSTAVVAVDWSGDLGQGVVHRAVLDLVTGQITPTELSFDTSDAYDPQYIGETADGAELWADGASTDATVSQVYRVTDGGTQELGLVGDQWLLDPSRRWLVAEANVAFDTNGLHLIDVIGGEHVEHAFGVPGQRCDVVGWLDPGQVLAFCVDDGLAVGAPVDPVSAHASWYRIDLSPAAATATVLARLGPSDPHPSSSWSGAWAAPGAVAFSGTTGDAEEPYSCAQDAYLWTGSSAEPIRLAPGATTYDFSEDPLLIASAAGCGDELSPLTLRRLDVGSGTSTMLAPEPPTTGEGPRWERGLTSWVPGSDR